MKLLIRRDQRSGMMGKVIFQLDVRAELSDEERRSIDKYKLGKEVLYSRDEAPNVDPQTLKGLGKLLVAAALNITVSVNDLVNGKRIEAKDILEMLSAEEQIREAAKNFNAVLHAAAKFGGEEVVDLAA
ncbi:MAG: hypothetical protein JO261_05670 [Alphaproteobacteria bacterium]|nr:hypothetical protein [Alphaproteobacteria bacterium]MBV9693169.1 hypothetical protein [Alphaproteobacteria bacterium]